jgi:MFS family permease
MALVGFAGDAAGSVRDRGISGRLVLMLALAMLVNYADRGSLAVAAPVLSRELAIGPAGMGLLLSAFFWSYSLAQPVAGMVVQRWPIRWVMAGGLLAWSVATMLCGLAVGFVSLFALRMMIGLGESVIYPANARVLSEHAPPHQRGQANGAISAAMALGPVVGTLVGGLILAHFGWQPVFWVLGAASLLWLPAWFRTALPRPTVRAGPAPGSGPGWGEILSQRALWGMGLGGFCYAYPPYLLMTWLPTFLVNAEHDSLIQMAWIGAAIPCCQALGSALSGILSDRAITAGQDESTVRKRYMQGGMGTCGLMMLGATFAPHGWVVIWLGAASFGAGWMSSMNFTAGQILAGPTAAGRWMGAQNLITNLSGVAAPLATGLIVAHTGSYRMAFLISALLSLVGLAAWGLLTGPIRQITWRGHI